MQKTLIFNAFALSKTRRCLWLLALLVLAGFTCGGTFPAQSAQSAQPANFVRVDFSPTTDEFANPERGFYQAASTDLDGLRPEYIAQAYAAGYRLIYARINLEPYRAADLPPAFLDRLGAAFATARQGGIKLIVRATYNYPRGETEYHDAKDASLDQVLEHLAQLKPVLQRNADVIAFVQAGFIGAWGEWHTSSNDLTSPVNRTRIKDALLDAVPDTRFVQFRYPPYMQDWSPALPGLEAALSGKFRMGFHNDCFLASNTDVGTYDEDANLRAGQQSYIDKLGDLGVFGAETCNPADEPGASPRAACADILGEGARFNLTYLNDGYYRRLFHDNWSQNGCMKQVRRSLGYRFALVSASHATSAARGANLAISIGVHNSGWARLYNPRELEVILRDPVSGAVRRIKARGVDPRQWLPGVDSTVTFDLWLPMDLPIGRQEVWLALPDADNRLRTDRRFAIRLANADRPEKGQKWDDALGAFALGTSVDIH